MKPSKRVLIWDLPVRLFHWLLAAGFFATVYLALVLGDDSRFFPYHAIIGLTMAMMVVMRILWGFIGSRYARFSSFLFGPRAVMRYVGEAVHGSGEQHVGHNPGAAWAIYAMIGLLLGLAATGVLMGQGDEGLKEVHEIIAYTLAVVVALHIIGAILHSIRYRDHLVASMVHGRKYVASGLGIGSSHSIVALIFCLVVAGWGLGMLVSYDAGARSFRLPVIGVTVQVGDEEHESGNEDRRHYDNDD